MDTRLVQLVEIEPLADYRLRVRFSDGAGGVADLSHLAGRGVFSLWNEPGAFERARIEEGRAVVWSEEVDLSADSLYLQVTGKSPDQLFPRCVFERFTRTSCFVWPNKPRGAGVLAEDGTGVDRRGD
jgi:hypothetical protein